MKEELSNTVFEDIENAVKDLESQKGIKYWDAKRKVKKLTRQIQDHSNLYEKKNYCENCNGILGYDCTYEMPEDGNSKGILTIEHWNGDPNDNSVDNTFTFCANCAQYKTNLYKDWLTPGRNKKLVDGRNWIQPVDFIYKDWVARINNVLFKNDLHNIKVIVGVTGQGKTFSIAEYMIPEFKKHGIRFIQVSAPQHGILDRKDFNNKALENGYQITLDATEALDILEDGGNVLFLSTHQALISDRGKELIEYCRVEAIKHAIIIDEIHTWLCTDAASYKDVLGWTMSKETGTLYKLLQGISSYNPFVFGLTATPNSQQLGKVPIGEDCKTTFEIINKMCPLDLMWRNQAWISDPTFYLDLDDITASLQKLKDAIIKIENHRIKTGVKKTLLVQCQTAAGVEEYQAPSVIEFIKDVYNEMGVGDEWRIAEMRTDDKSKKINRLYKGDGSIDASQTEKSLKRELDKNNSDASVLVVVNKGGMGMNIRTLKGLISFKKTNKKDSNKNTLIEFVIQIIGRLVRPLVDVSPKEYSKKFDFDWFKYYMSLETEEERANAVDTNSFFYMIADNDMNRDADKVFRKSYANDISFVNKLISNL
jgi:hypothetical protein